MIFISNGMPKSASSFSFLLCNEVASIRTPRHLFKRSLPEHLQPMYVHDITEILDELVEAVPQQQVYVLKTHTPFNEKIRQHLENGTAMASYSYRDPYDIVMALFDAGKSEREKPDPAERREAFASIFTIEDALKHIPGNIKNARAWLEQVDKLPGVSKVPFETLRKYPSWVVEEYARLFGVRLNADAVVNKFLSNKKLIWEYNKGQSGRGHSEIQIADDHPVKKLMDEFNTDYPQP